MSLKFIIKQETSTVALIGAEMIGGGGGEALNLSPFLIKVQKQFSFSFSWLYTMKPEGGAYKL